MHAELRGEVYGYKSSCAEASGDVESRAVERVYIISPILGFKSLWELQSIAKSWHRLSRFKNHEEELFCIKGTMADFVDSLV
jgi:hypothetical protein